MVGDKLLCEEVIDSSCISKVPDKDVGQNSAGKEMGGVWRFAVAGGGGGVPGVEDGGECVGGGFGPA